MTNNPKVPEEILNTLAISDEWQLIFSWQEAQVGHARLWNAEFQVLTLIFESL